MLQNLFLRLVNYGMIKELRVYGIRAKCKVKFFSHDVPVQRERFAGSVCFAVLDYQEKKRNLVSLIFSRKSLETGMTKFLILLPEFLIPLMK